MEPHRHPRLPAVITEAEHHIIKCCRSHLRRRLLDQDGVGIGAKGPHRLFPLTSPPSYWSRHSRLILSLQDLSQTLEFLSLFQKWELKFDSTSPSQSQQQNHDIIPFSLQSELSCPTPKALTKASPNPHRCQQTCLCLQQDQKLLLRYRTLINVQP